MMRSLGVCGPSMFRLGRPCRCGTKLSRTGEASPLGSASRSGLTSTVSMPVAKAGATQQGCRQGAANRRSVRGQLSRLTCSKQFRYLSASVAGCAVKAL